MISLMCFRLFRGYATSSSSSSSSERKGDRRSVRITLDVIRRFWSADSFAAALNAQALNDVRRKAAQKSCFVRLLLTYKDFCSLFFELQLQLQLINYFLRSLSHSSRLALGHTHNVHSFHRFYLTCCGPFYLPLCFYFQFLLFSYTSQPHPSFTDHRSQTRSLAHRMGWSAITSLHASCKTLLGSLSLQLHRSNEKRAKTNIERIK